MYKEPNDYAEGIVFLGRVLIRDSKCQTENINIINIEHLTNNEKHWEKIISDQTVSEHNHIKQAPIYEPVISQKTTQHKQVIIVNKYNVLLSIYTKGQLYAVIID